MEQELDDIAEGKEKWVPFMRSFYEPFLKLVNEKTKDIKKAGRLKDRELRTDPKQAYRLSYRTGRFQRLCAGTVG